MKTITKKDLVARIVGQRRPAGQAARAEATRTEVKRTIQSFLALIVEELALGHRLEFRGFGVFEVKARAARVAQNPRTLQRVRVPPGLVVRFKPGRLMRAAVKNGKAPPAPAAPKAERQVEVKRKRRTKVSA